MSSIWDRFDGIASANEVADAQVQFAPLPAGDYECILESIKPSESKQRLPMIKGKFKVIETGKTIYYNQTLQNATNPQMTAVNIADAVNFISDLTGEEVVFTSMSQFAEVVSNITFGGQYTVKVSYGAKDLEQKFPKLKITNRVVEDDSLPFEA